MSRISIQGNGKLSPNLTKKEVRAASFDGAPDINALLPPLFELVRKLSGNKPAKVHSAYRDFVPPNGVADSPHLTGDAFDIHLSSLQMAELRKNARELLEDGSRIGLGGLGVYPWGVHIDTKQGTNFWGTDEMDGGIVLRHWNESGVPLFYVGKFENSPIEYESEPAQKSTSVLPILIILGLAFFIFKNSKK